MEQNQYILLRDRDWMHIFSEIGDNPDTYGHYYPMVRVKCDSEDLCHVVRAFVLNDELYAFVEELGRNASDSTEDDNTHQ